MASLTATSSADRKQTLHHVPNAPKAQPPFWAFLRGLKQRLQQSNSPRRILTLECDWLSGGFVPSSPNLFGHIADEESLCGSPKSQIQAWPLRSVNFPIFGICGDKERSGPDPFFAIEWSGGCKGSSAHSEHRVMHRLTLILLLVGVLPGVGIAQMSPIFGPKQYTRSAGKPQSFTDTFLNCETAAQYNLVIINGNPDGSNRISSATIALNGTQLAGPSDFNQNVAQVTKPVTVAGSNTLQTTLASEPGSFLTVSLQCASNCLNVQIISPTSGNDLSVSSTNVSGTVSSTADEVGVVVNGIPAAVQNGNFVAPNVPLSLGTSTLTATATNACLNQATETEQVNVTAVTAPAVTLTAAPTSGLAPLTVSFKTTVSSAHPLTNYQWAFNGDGVIESSGAALSQTSNTYTQPGLYLATVTATDSMGNQYTGQVPVQVFSRTALSALLQTRWLSLKSELQSQNVTAALGLFNPSVVLQYHAVFSELGSQLPQIASSFGNVGLFSEFNGVTELITVRTQDGSEFVYFIYVVQDENGLWKFISM